MTASPSKIMFVWGHRETLWFAAQSARPMTLLRAARAARTRLNFGQRPSTKGMTCERIGDRPTSGPAFSLGDMSSQGHCQHGIEYRQTRLGQKGSERAFSEMGIQSQESPLVHRDMRGDHRDRI